MSFDLTNKNISDTYQNLLQKTGSHLYDLVGNKVRDLTIDGTLTANSYVTSQSLTVVSSGSNIFGNSVDDIHKFTGLITASGDLYLTGKFINPITASGNISSSGQLIAASADFNEGNITNIGEVMCDSINDDATGGDTKIEFTGTTMNFDVAGSTILQTTANTANFYAPIKTTSHITASGNISSSGNLILGAGTIEGTDLNIDVSSTLNFKRNGATYAQIASGKFLIKDNREIAFGDGSDYSMGYKSSDDTFRLVDGADVDSNARMVVNSSGNFGIGTTSPSKKLEVSGSISASGAMIYNVHTFADGDLTPDVSNGYMFKTANTGATDITGFDGGSAGQTIIIFIQDGNTDFTNGSNLNLYRGGDYNSSAANDVLTFVCLDGTKWYMQNTGANNH